MLNTLLMYIPYETIHLEFMVWLHQHQSLHLIRTMKSCMLQRVTLERVTYQKVLVRGFT